MAIGLSATHAAFAKPNNVDKAVATRKTGKRWTQLREKSGAGINRLHVETQKNRKSGRNDTRTKKSSSCINGTTIHRNH